MIVVRQLQNQGRLIRKICFGFGETIATVNTNTAIDCTTNAITPLFHLWYGRQKHVRGTTPGHRHSPYDSLARGNLFDQKNNPLLIVSEK